MASRNKTKAELQAENKVLRNQNLSKGWSNAVNNLIKWSGTCVIAYFGLQAISVLAGKETSAYFGFGILTQFKVNVYLAWLFGISGIVYGQRQRSLRYETIERLQGRIKELEKELDLRRTSSGLTKRGTTHPEDE